MLELVYSQDLSSGGSLKGEVVPVVDPSGVVVGAELRSEVHGGSKALHPVVHLHVLNPSGEILLQKRARSKDFLPGMWDSSVGGHVSYGESIEEALFREAKEELGLVDFNPFFMDSYVFESERERELVAVFATVGDFSFCPDADEVETVAFKSDEKIMVEFHKGSLTPNFEEEYLRYRSKLSSLI